MLLLNLSYGLVFTTYIFFKSVFIIGVVHYLYCRWVKIPSSHPRRLPVVDADVWSAPRCRRRWQEDFVSPWRSIAERPHSSRHPQGWSCLIELLKYFFLKYLLSSFFLLWLNIFSSRSSICLSKFILKLDHWSQKVLIVCSLTLLIFHPGLNIQIPVINYDQDIWTHFFV